MEWLLHFSLHTPTFSGMLFKTKPYCFFLRIAPIWDTIPFKGDRGNSLTGLEKKYIFPSTYPPSRLFLQAKGGPFKLHNEPNFKGQGNHHAAFIGVKLGVNEGQGSDHYFTFILVAIYLAIKELFYQQDILNFSSFPIHITCPNKTKVFNSLLLSYRDWWADYCCCFWWQWHQINNVKCLA